jgi:hypothetical protein
VEAKKQFWLWSSFDSNMDATGQCTAYVRVSWATWARVWAVWGLTYPQHVGKVQSNVLQQSLVRPPPCSLASRHVEVALTD